MQNSALLLVLADVRVLLAREGNDFIYAGWDDTADALREFDALVEHVRHGALPTMLAVLFAPTGPLQEVSLASGWGEVFVELAARFDAAISPDV